MSILTVKENRTILAQFRLTVEEDDKLYRKWQASKFKKRSDFMRHCLFERQAKIVYRDQSLDQLMEELIRLRNEIIRIENNHTQVMTKLKTMRQFTDVREWLLKNESTEKSLHTRIESSYDFIGKMDEKWLR